MGAQKSAAGRSEEAGKVRHMSWLCVPHRPEGRLCGQRSAGRGKSVQPVLWPRPPCSMAGVLGKVATAVLENQTAAAGVAHSKNTLTTKPCTTHLLLLLWDGEEARGSRARYMQGGEDAAMVILHGLNDILGGQRGMQRALQTGPLRAVLHGAGQW